MKMLKKIQTEHLFTTLLEHHKTTEENIAIHTIQEYLKQLEQTVFPEPKDPLVKKWIDEGLIRK